MQMLDQSTTDGELVGDATVQQSETNVIRWAVERLSNNDTWQ